MIEPDLTGLSQHADLFVVFHSLLQLLLLVLRSDEDDLL